MGRGRIPGAKDRWSDELIATERRRVKAELDALPTEAKDDRCARLDKVVTAIAKHENDLSTMGQLRRYLYVMSGLVHHERFGGMSDVQVRRLSVLAYAILQVQRIQPSSRRLGHLFGDIHLILSMIARKAGEHWRAAWEQQLAVRLFRKNADRGTAFRALSLAIRTLRLGHADDAVDLYTEAQNDVENELGGIRASLGRIRSLRLAGRYEESEELLKSLRVDPEAYPSEDKELQWERLCLNAQKDQNLLPLVLAVGRGGSHVEPIYLLETWLRAHVTQSLQWIDRLPKASTLSRRTDLKQRLMLDLFECVQAIGDCYDKDVRYENKLRRLGDALACLHKLPSIECELLMLGAALRWLRRSRADGLAKLTESRYKVLCWSLTSARESDLLAVRGAVAVEDEYEVAS